MRRISSFLTMLLCLAVFLAPGRAVAAIDAATVEAAWRRIAAAADIKNVALTYEKDEAPNAWVKFESQKRFTVHVTYGLMRILSTADEIAGILGHEVGHVRRGHYNRGMQRNIGWNILGALLGQAGDAAQIVGAVGMNLAESGFSREQEVEADDYGMDLAVKAGYSPWGLYNAMKSFKDNGYATGRSGFNSHPPTERRLRHLRERAERIEKGRQ
ncbi:MAG: M48 family metalloprotease [Fretibacterium sp.]|nr:M48 family metalloprotease [Fretibacterium sp.]